MKNRTNDSYHDGIHCVGNGRAGCYIHGADIESLFAPCYSAPSALSLRVSAEIGTKSRRRKGTGIWETEILRDGQEIGLMCDFTHPEEPFFPEILFKGTAFLSNGEPISDNRCSFSAG